jgi:iron complex outermembrane recepter protein
MDSRLLCRLLVVPATLLGSGVATAQIEEVVVTAQRREESMQNVPITVSAVTADTLNALGAVDVLDLASTAPGLYVGRQLGSPLIYLRGIGTTSTQGGQESPTALYVDGVYYAELPGLNFSFNNIERIEVLKGPQGTLFGRNATGGLVQIITKDPSQDASMDIGFTAANYETFGGKLYATTGIGDNLAADIAFVGSDQGEGWGRNRTLDVETGLTDDYGVRSTWLWTPSDATFVRASFDWTKTETTVGLSRQAAPGSRSIDGQGPPDDIYDDLGNIANNEEIEAFGAAVKIGHSFGAADLVSITAYRDTDTDIAFDQDNTPLPLVNAPIFYRTEQFSQELQLLSSDSERFDWIVGLYYLDLDFDYQLVLNGLAFSGPPFGAVNLGGVDDKHSRQPVKSYSGYAQGTWAVGDASHITAGIRYTSDEREFSGTDSFTGIGLVVPSSAPPKVTQEEPTWRLSFDHRFSEEWLVFASYNRGFKSGLYNMVNLAQPAVESEIVDAYEIGFKSDLMDDRLRLNGAAFFYDYQDLQIQIINAGITVLDNAAEAEVQGVELELQAAPTDNLTIFAGLGYLDTEYSKFPNAQLSTPRPPPAGGNVIVTGPADGNELVRAPGFSGSLALDYRIPTSSGTWGINGSYVYTGSFFWEPDNRREQEGYGLLNAQLGWESPSEMVHIYLFGRNLADEEYSQFVSDGGLGDSAAWAAPRTYGVGVDFSFGE